MRHKCKCPDLADRTGTVSVRKRRTGMPECCSYTFACTFSDSFEVALAGKSFYREPCLPADAVAANH
eukprot:6174387-Pleurochrysis_carterae.AAC.1